MDKTFAIGDKVSTFDPNMEPLVPTDSIGEVVGITDTGYDVRLETTEDTTEDFFFFEYELSEAK